MTIVWSVLLNFRIDRFYFCLVFVRVYVRVLGGVPSIYLSNLTPNVMQISSGDLWGSEIWVFPFVDFLKFLFVGYPRIPNIG
jgi:hypothetical protein